MRLNVRKAALAFAACLAPIGPAPGPATAAQAPGQLLAGAARIDVTPAAADLPAPFKTIHDKLFVRAVVFDDGKSRAAIVIADASTFAPKILTSLRQAIADQIHAPAGNVLLATTHDHSAVRIDPEVEGLVPGSPKIAEATLPLILQAVKTAQADLQPVRIGYAEGTTQLVARRARPPGADRAVDEQLADQGPPNTSVGVLRIDTLSGQPLAFIFNAGLEPIVGFAQPSEVGADVAGASERYIERRYGDKAVALYTVGTLANTPYNARRQGPQPPADPHALIDAMGTLLGEDVLAAAAWIKPMDGGQIRGALKVIECPGKVTTPLNIPERCSDTPGSALPKCVFTTKDGDPVTLEVGVLRIGAVTFVQSDADIATGIWRRLGAPQDAAFVSTSYGPTHYVVEDADYPLNAYPATATMAKPGCAARGFVAAASELMRQTR